VSLFEDPPDHLQDWPPPSEPVKVARRLIEEDDLRHDDGNLTLRWWRGCFYEWTGSHWLEIADPTIRAGLYQMLDGAMYYKAVQDGDPELVPWAPTRRKVGDVLEALQAVAHLSERTGPPAWIDGEEGGQVLAVRNGLLDLDGRKLADHTPRLFNLHALPYDYDPQAPPPRRWLRFLRQLWPGDPDSRRLLAEWFGYVLSGDTRLQKILLLVGPPRSGKGTIARVLTALVGKANTAGPTLASLATNFGLAPLLGKPLAIVSDARLGPDTHAVIERLLSISGEDAITVDRKHRDAWTGQLPTRFTVISNELPNFGDASGAIASRFEILTLTRSWLGKERPRLTDELLEELPGILLWALKGLDRLRDQRHFTGPAASRDAVKALADLTSPVGAFVREACELDPAHEIPRRTLYQAWRRWSKDHGRDRATTDAVFGRDLRAAFPGIQDGRPHIGGRRTRIYQGIRLSETYAAYVEGTAHQESNGGPVHDGPWSNPLRAVPESAGQASSEHAAFEWVFADQPVGACVVCGNQCVTLDDHAHPCHPRCREREGAGR
jgi:putative DNA primase/helicase